MTTTQEHPGSQGQRIVSALGGRWNGRSGQCRCPAHEDHSPSLSVRLGDHSLLFTCFAGCSRADVIAALRRHGLLGGGLATTTEPLPRPSRRDALRNHDLVQWVWDRSLPVAGSIAETYFRGRAITSASAELRFQPDARIGRGGSAWRGPALLAAVREGSKLVALQRTFLVPDGSAKAAIPHPRRMLGEPGQGAVQLSRAGSILGLAEGLETALSAAALLGLPVWAALGTQRFGEIAIPPQVEQLVLLPDPDVAGRAAAERATASLARPGLTITTRYPPRGAGDWNDLAQAGRGEGARLA